MMECNDAFEKGDLLLLAPAGWDAYISKEFYEIHQILSGLGWKLIVVDGTDDERLLECARQASVILAWECYELLERQEKAFSELPRNVKRIAFCDDVHYFNSSRKMQRKRVFDWADLILATYPDKIADWFPDVVKKVKWTPHAAASYFAPIYAPASDQILLSGSRTWPYPFRQFCAAKLAPDVCYVVDHPGYPGYPGDQKNQMRANPKALAAVGGERYASLLRRHPAMLVCGSIFNYLVAKVFEGMASGCLIVAERSSLGRALMALGFYEGEHYIGTDIFHVIEDVDSVRQLSIDDNRRWSGITERAARKVAAHHTTAVRAREIHKLCLDGSRN